MKFWKNILISGILIGTLGLASCSNKQSQNNEENDPPIVDIENPTGDRESETEYLNLNVTYTSTQLDTGSVEDTVEQIYDSVVAIDAYMNNQHYGSGSGVLFGFDEKFSYIATCHHVIEGCQGFKIILSNEETLEAKLVGGDAESDIAVLSVEKTGLTYASWFEDTEKLRLGSSVICIGNPLGTLPGSVSTGVVSYNNRIIQVDSYHSMKLIQTDVAINSGNSGGGLFNAAGALIGIVNAKYSSSGIEGLGFAIPANQARTIIDSILKTARYNVQEEAWETGYVEGRWELGFTLGYGSNLFYRTSIGIASIATNPTHSDYNKLQVNDKLNAITITYKDDAKEVLSLTNITAQTTTLEGIYQFIYSAGLSIGDVITFDITRGNENVKIEISLIQYVYNI
ncbi:MAG: trypsin-like peptidase domain-containing protein [Anaeroplasmataceae bacterium]|nr:trypsin-like peptidase domain-containing protein [Anaeroplasmataceae bacterium]